MKELDYLSISIPNDIAHKIASSLEVSDLSSMSCCSRVWREIWGSDWLWEPLFKERWPLLYQDVSEDPNFKGWSGWKGFYMRKHHKEMKDQAESIIKFVEYYSKSELLKLELKHLLNEAEGLKSTRFRFKDVQMLLFNPNLNVLVNLVGLHYCLNILGVQASDVMEALESSKILHREFDVKCWIYHWTWFHGSRDEYRCRRLFLKDLARPNLLSALHQGPINEVLRAQIPNLFPQAISRPNKSYTRTNTHNGYDYEQIKGWSVCVCCVTWSNSIL